jgi:hypothetical protein
MNGGLWSNTPKNPLFSGYNFLCSNSNVVFERRCKEITHYWVLDFLESLICFKKSFKMSMTSYTSYDQRPALRQSFSHFGAYAHRQTRETAKFKNTTVIVSRNVVLIVFQSTM